MADSAILSESSVLIGYPNGLGISRVVPTKKKKFPFWPYNESFIDQAWTVKMAKYFSFFALLLTTTSIWSMKRKKELGQYLVILTEGLVNNP